MKTIDRDDLLQMMRRDEPFRLVMALNQWAFEAKHIPGSEHFNSPDELYSAIDEDEDVVVYCTSEDCHSSLAMYHSLVERGYGKVRRYSGGLTDWESNGLPLEGDWA